MWKQMKSMFVQKNKGKWYVERRYSGNSTESMFAEFPKVSDMKLIWL